MNEPSCFFFTGFPGFLGTELISSLLPKIPEAKAICLVQTKFKAAAELQKAQLIIRHPELKERISLIEGDITLPHLGIEHLSAFTETVTQIFHLAAVYDLGVQAEIAHRINVLGTDHVLHFAENCPQLKRFHYVSTCYVSGKYEGVFSEADLDVGQTFNNHYEETKFKAEVAVQAKMRSGLPAMIYRPSVVVGNSKTGETQKLDGPYYVIQWLLRQGRIAILPSIGNPKTHSLNVVPSDYVIEAMSYLCQQENLVGKIFHLSDPNPLSVETLVQELGRVTHRKIISIPLSLGFAKAALEKIPGVEALLKIPASTLNYFVHPTHYSSTETSAHLNQAGISVPPFSSYSEKLVEYMIQHPNLRTQAMI